MVLSRAAQMLRTFLKVLQCKNYDLFFLIQLYYSKTYINVNFFVFSRAAQQLTKIGPLNGSHAFFAHVALMQRL